MTRNRKVQCWIFSETGNCLILKTIASRGGFWQPVTGSVEEGESFSDAAFREPVEETGFRFDGEPSDTGFEFDFESRFGPATEKVFALRVKGQPKPRIDPKEHEAFEWLSPEEALGRMSFDTNVEGLKRSYKLSFGKELHGKDR